MVCQTIKAGIECAFMTKKGCGFNGGSCHQIIDKCEGCNKIIEYATGKYCMIYPNPAGKWAIGGCPSASNKKEPVPFYFTQSKILFISHNLFLISANIL